MKNVLFIHTAEKFKEDEKGCLYTDGSYCEDVWNRYLGPDRRLTVMARKEPRIYPQAFARSHFQPFDRNRIRFIPLNDRLASVKDFVSIRNILDNRKKIYEQIRRNDYLVYRGCENPLVVRQCRRCGTKLLAEVVGCTGDALWNYNRKGRVLAPFACLCVRLAVWRAGYVVYVTDHFLQRRYPSAGRTFALSDVDLPSAGSGEIKRRMDLRMENFDKKKMRAGTIGSADVPYKGHRYVIKALADLKKEGYHITYEIAGGNKDGGAGLKRLAERLGVRGQVRFRGSMTHDQVFRWLDTLDVYIHPSLLEGRCRSIIEAMSRGCCVLAADTGGNPELVSGEFLFRKKSAAAIKAAIKKLDRETVRKNANRNLKFSERFERSVITKQRDQIYGEFFDEN